MKYTTGAIKNTKDNRDINYKDIPATATPLPSKHITDISMIPVLNQDLLGTCVAHAIIIVKIYQEYLATGKIIMFSRRFLYSLARLLSAYVGEGLHPRDGAKIIKEIGARDNDDIDNNNLSHNEYVLYKPTQAEKDLAKKWVSGFATTINGDIDTIKRAIIKEGMVTITLNYDGNVWNSVTGQLGKPKNKVSAHYIALYGYEDVGGDTIFYFRNSWGKGWGNNGNGQFNWSDYKKDAYDALIFTDIPNDLIEKAKTTQFLFTVNLAFKSTHNDVKRLQERLRDEGYYQYPSITGYFGTVTKQAVIDYQKAKSIKPASGYVGPLTRAELNKPISKKNSREISNVGLQMIKDFEWLHDGNPKTSMVEPMLDPVGYPTIGWGSRYDKNGKEVTMKTPAITLAECDDLLKRDVGYIATELNKYDLNQNQFDALTSFCYNLGVGAFQKSQIAKNLKSGANITEEMFTVYSKARDQKTKELVTLKGLVIRRKKEFALFKK